MASLGAAATVALAVLGLALWGVGGLAVGIGAGAALLIWIWVLRLRESQRFLRDAAFTDPLTGLGNRRKLLHHLEQRLDAAKMKPTVLAICDLDGFKDYNDAFGHPAGDALLIRLTHELRRALAGHGKGYRIGGDEFCVVVEAENGQAALGRALGALSERGEGFRIGASHGAVELPRETTDPAEALRIADQRLYASKSDGPAAAGREATEALVSVLRERHPGMTKHGGEVEALCRRLAERLGMSEDERAALEQAAALHDIGKIALPDSILRKDGPLDEEEWEFIHQHTLIGERILDAAPALPRAAKMVRSSHERWDGGGYPDRVAGEEIPLGARIIAVCDAFCAMTTNRPFAPARKDEDALAELRRGAGSNFDPQVVEAFCDLFEQSASEGGTPVS